MTGKSPDRGPASAAPIGAVEADYDWWRRARFGIFIHWGTSSLLELGGGSWYRGGSDRSKGRNLTAPESPAAITDGSYQQYRGQKPVPMEIYDNLHHLFCPEGFDADEWAETFKSAGAGYVVLTTKHHDGFCLFETEHTDYSVMHTPFARDICAELAEACHKRGIEVLWYYSKADWYDPRHDLGNPCPYQDYLNAQVRELCSNYGRIRGMWWDGGAIEIDTAPLFEMIHELQPGCITNGRIGNPPGVKFSTPEQRLGSFNLGHPWESCVTMQGEGWFWNGGQHIRTLNSCLRLLISCAVGDGNLLLDFGPRADGCIHEPIRQNYLGMGLWLDAFGDSIYGTRGGPYMPGNWGGSTRENSTVYLHVTHRWPGGVLHLPTLPKRVRAAQTLGGVAVAWEQTSAGLRLELAEEHHDAVDTVIVLTLDGTAMDIEPIPAAPGPSLTVDAAMTASSVDEPRHHPSAVVEHSREAGGLAAQFGEDAPDIARPKRSPDGKPVGPWGKTHRGHIWRYWRAAEDDPQPWLEADLGQPRRIHHVYLREKFNRVAAFELQYHTGSAWQTCHRGTEIDTFQLQLPAPITARRVRLVVTGRTADGPPGIHEFDLYGGVHGNAQ